MQLQRNGGKIMGPTSRATKPKRSARPTIPHSPPALVSGVRWRRMEGHGYELFQCDSDFDVSPKFLTAFR